MPSALSAPHFYNEISAYVYVEERIWPDGPVCPRCGTLDRIGKLRGKSTRVGTYKCYECRKPFTVKIGTIFEASHVAMHIWLQAMYLIAGSKKGISSNQLHCVLGVTLKTAWFMSHRIREAMRSGDFSPFGTDGGAVEVDEAYIGQKANRKKARGGWAHKMQILLLVDRDTGRVRSYTADQLNASVVNPIMLANISREARLMTDEAHVYKRIGREFAEHGTTFHGIGEYVRGDVHSNTVEGYFSIFKRGMRGVYQHCQEKHLHHYLAEFDFRYTHRVATGMNDKDRADAMLMGVVGKRLTYETAGKGA